MKPFKIAIIDTEETEVKLNTENEIKAYRKKFVDGSGDGAKNYLADMNRLNDLSNEDLLDRFVNIDNQAEMMKWRICWVLRQRFESDKLFGQCIEEFMGSTQTLCQGRQKEINRAWRAGKFCENYGIDSLIEFKLSKTVVYELSQAVNEDIAGKVLDSIKTKDVPITVQETKLLLAQNRAVATIYPSNVELEADVIESEVIDQISSEVLFTDEDQGIAKIIEFVQLYQEVVSKKRLIAELEKLIWD